VGADQIAAQCEWCFYTDVHARTEWDTPDAMALAANAINARKSDMVISGGDFDYRWIFNLLIIRSLPGGMPT